MRIKMGWGELTGFFGSEPNFPTPNFLELKKTWISKRAQKNYFRVSPIRFFGFFFLSPLLLPDYVYKAGVTG